MVRSLVLALVVGQFVVHTQLLAQQKSTATTPPAGHAHPAHGPHGGELLEVGKEEYHVELVIDEAKKQLDVYLMDGNAKGFVSIDAPHLVVNLKIAGKPVQLKLLPIPQEVDKKGFSSRFGLTSSQLLEALHGGHADARLALKLGKKAYTVKIEHDHDHAGHKHGPSVAK